MYRSILYGIFLTLLFVGGSLLYIVKKTFTKDFFNVLIHVDKKYMLMSFACMLLYHTFDNIRFFVLSRAMKLRYSFFYGYVISYINTFGATITPSQAGGEFMSMYTLSRKGGKLHKVLSILTMKMLSGSTFFILALPYVLLHIYKNPSQGIRIGYVLLFFLALVLFSYILLRLFFKRKSSNQQKLIQRLKYNLKKYLVVLKIFLRDKKASILIACLSSVLVYMSFLASGAFLLKSFNPKPEILTLIEHQLLLLYAIFMSPTPGGSGVGEVGALYAFEPFLELSLLGGFSLLWRFITQYLSAIIGGFLLAFLLIKDAKRFKDA